ncbi:unnamed protein product [Tetraodon nigroviridis]|uniref:(spotted green pufferfish) hypothetical protein n=1 Tax=Tetraodon nigroviridis TaxID=99883 RepID=Q4RR87_TETNG|nr:unnamed protein product [Tetraodon nigroviridis]
MRSRNLGAKAGVRKTSSIYVRALQRSVPYHSRTPPKHTHARTHIRAHTHTLSFYTESLKEEEKSKREN